MKVTVKLAGNGYECVVFVENDQTVGDLKNSIVENKGPPKDVQRLYFNGELMTDGKLISEYNLQENCIVRLLTGNHNVKFETSKVISPSSDINMTLNNDQLGSQQTPKSDNLLEERFEIILREKLAEHMSPGAVDKFISDLRKDIEADELTSLAVRNLELLTKDSLRISDD